MKTIHALWLTACLCTLVLASCLPPIVSEPVIIRSDGIFSGLYTLAERHQACDIPPDFRAYQAFLRSPADKPILWTFGINFETLAEGRPLGCLRLYRRDATATTVIPIDGGGILVDTCQITPPGSVVLTGDEAIFDELGYIQCEMNLQAWVSSLRTSLPGLDTDPIRGELDNFSIQETHTYTTFTMVASVTIASTNTYHDDVLVPILFYAPQEVGEEIDFSIRILDSQRGTFPVPLCTASEYPNHIDPNPIQCASYSINSSDSRFWWYDLDNLGRSSPELEYHYDDDTSFPVLVSSRPYAYRSLKFGIGPATLYIGYNPETGEHFHGTIDSVLIDPNDSKPTK